MSDSAGRGYLAQAEASRVHVVSGPGVVYLRLERALAGEPHRASMFAELTPALAVKVRTEFDEAIRSALRTRTA